MKLFFALLCMLTFPLAAARGADTRGTPDALRPYIDSQTLLVATLNVSKLDPAAIDQAMTDALNSAKVADTSPAAVRIHAAITALNAPLAQFAKLGGKHVYVIVSHRDFWPTFNPPVVLVPVERGSDASALTDFLRPIAASHELTADTLTQDLLFIGNAQTLAHLKAIKPQARPDIDDALASAPDAALKIAFAPTADSRRALSELMPQLPEAAGGGPIAPLTSELKWIALSFDPPPTASLTIRAQAQTPETARQLADLAHRAIAAASGNIPPGPNGAVAVDPIAFAARHLLGALQPKIEDSAAITKVTPEQFKDLYPDIATALVREADVARARDVGRKLREIAQACVVWSNAYKDAMPDHLGRLLLENQISPKELTARLTTTPLNLTPDMREKAKTDFPAFAKQVDEHCDFVYLGNGMKNTIDSAVILAYEKPGPQTTNGVTAVFMDAHSELLIWNELPGVFDNTNIYRKKMNLPPVDLDALMKSAPPK